MALVENEFEHLVLVIRGAEAGTEMELRDRLLRDSKARKLQIRVFPYSADEGRIGDEIKKSSVLLMPSRAEGFGLVAAESLSLGVPVLVTESSGFGELLEMHLQKEKADQWLAPARHHRLLKEDAQAWAHKLRPILNDRASAFRKTALLAKELAGEYSWDGCAGTIIEALDNLPGSVKR